MKKLKKLVATAVCLLTVLSGMAQKKVGFSTSSDLLLGYKDKIFSATIGYDFGY